MSFHIKAAMAGAVISGSRSAIETAMETGRAAQQQRDCETEQQLEHDGQRGVGQRDAERVPERRIRGEIEVVLDSDETAQIWQVQSIPLQRIDRRREERDQNRHAYEQRRQTQQIRQHTATQPCHADRAGVHLKKLGHAHCGARKEALLRRGWLGEISVRASSPAYGADKPAPVSSPKHQPSPACFSWRLMLSASLSRPSSTLTSFATIF